MDLLPCDDDDDDDMTVYLLAVLPNLPGQETLSPTEDTVMAGNARTVRFGKLRVTGNVVL